MPADLPEREEEECCPKCGLPYPERGRAVCPRCMEKSTVMLRILAYFKEYRWRVVVMLLCVAASGVLNAIWPYLSGTVLYDKVLGKNGDFASSLGFGGNFMLMLGFLVFIMTVTKLLQQITGVIHGRMTAYMVPGVVCKIKNSVFAALQKLSVGFFTRRQTGSLMQRVNADANEVMQFFIDGLPYLLFNVLTILVTAVVMFVMDWRLALVALFLRRLCFWSAIGCCPASGMPLAGGPGWCAASIRCSTTTLPVRGWSKPSARKAPRISALKRATTGFGKQKSTLCITKTASAWLTASPRTSQVCWFGPWAR